MKNVAILTFHHTPNYGAVLQAFALKKTVEKLGCNVQIVDYRCKLVEENFSKIKFYKFRNIFNYIKYLKKWKFLKIKLERFDEFINKDLIKTAKTYYKKEELVELNNLYHYFICGSDQVWNYKITNFDKSYFLDFVNNHNKKISYAASLGLTNIPNEYVEEYRVLLNRFDGISVREETAASIIGKIISKDVPCVLDPTMLLSKNEWTKMLDIQKSDKKFILLYELEQNDEMYNCAYNMAKLKELSLVVISNRSNITKDNSIIVNTRTASPIEFLNYISNSEYVITNSFHGMALSLVFNKQFFPFLLQNANNVNSRIINLLDRYNLSNRLNNKSCEEIDYKDINKLISEMRKKSIKYLKSELEINYE